MIGSAVRSIVGLATGSVARSVIGFVVGIVAGWINRWLAGLTVGYDSCHSCDYNVVQNKAQLWICQSHSIKCIISKFLKLDRCLPPVHEIYKNETWIWAYTLNSVYKMKFCGTILRETFLVV